MQLNQKLREAILAPVAIAEVEREVESCDVALDVLRDAQQHAREIADGIPLNLVRL